MAVTIVTAPRREHPYRPIQKFEGTMLKVILLTGLLSMLAATGATALAFMSIEQQHSATRPLATTHMLRLAPDLALP